MLRVLCFAFMMVIALDQADATPPEVCQVRSGPKYCIIEHSRFTHKLRYEYNWTSKDCYVINWSYSCPVPTGQNNFDDYDTCIRECGGWA